MKFTQNENSEDIICFTPRAGITIDDGVYLSSSTELIKLASDVDITLDGVTVTYEAGYEVVLAAGVSYTFATSVEAHKM